MLGPVEVVANGKVVPLGRRQERLLLAVLALSANQLIPAARLVALLWTDEVPSQPYRTLQVYVSRLRKALPAEAAITGRDQGYRLDISPESIDVARFRELRRIAATSEQAAERSRLLGQALELWRGPALSDVASEELRHRLCAGLEEERLTALEDRIHADLEAGAGAELVPELAGLLALHPTREGLLAAQSLALYRAGRRLDALELLTVAKRNVRAEVGLQLSPRLQELEVAILRDDPGLSAGRPVAVPRQLPPAPRTFVGRQTQLDALTELLAARANGSAGSVVVVSAISGMAGVGKSALAVEVAHRVADLFPDGQLFLDLRGYGAEEPMAPIDAISAALRGLGVAGDEVPADPSEASAQCRSILAQRRVLLVLDNVAGSGAVDGLLPGAGASATIVTSRSPLSGLDAAQIQLDVLTAAEAAELLQQFAGPARMAAEPEAAAALLSACGYLPLAIRILGARLASRPAWPISHLVQRVADVHGRLDQLSLEGTSIRTVFASSLEHLERSADPIDRQAAAAFLRLGVPDAAHLRLLEAARVLGVDETTAETVLERLVDAQLLETPAPGSYRLHDLLWAFAREQAEAGLTTADRSAVIGRLVELYAAVAWQCLESRGPTAARLEWAAGRRKAGEVPENLQGEQGFDWLDAAGAKVTALALQGAQSGETTREGVLSLVLGLSTYTFSRECWPDALRRATVALEIARQTSDRLAEGLLLSDLGVYRAFSGDVEGAVEAYREAIPLLETCRVTRAELAALNNFNRVLHMLGRHAEGVEYGLRAVTLAERHGEVKLEAGARLSVGLHYQALGDPGRQRQYLESALRCSQEAANKWQQAFILDELGQLNHLENRLAEAVDRYRAGIALYDELSQNHDRDLSVGQLGEVLLDLGRLDEAVPALETGLREAIRAGDEAREERLRRRLSEAQAAAEVEPAGHDR